MKRFTELRGIALSALMLTTVTLSAEDGALRGKFTVNADGDQVVFSQGNLQYQAVCETGGGKWQFAEKQTTFLDKGPNIAISETNQGWIDLFGWGTGNNPTNASTDNADYARFAEWGDNPIANGGNMPNQWRTLTAEEWMYILHGRQDADQKLGIGTVNGVKGIILLPDVWETPLNEMGMPIVFYSLNARNVSWLNSYYFNQNKNNFELTTFSENGWADMEAAGAVFLPVTGLRTGTVMDYVSSMGGYHSATKKDDEHAWYMSFNQSEIIPNGYCALSSGYAVRLVQDCQKAQTTPSMMFMDMTGKRVRQMEATIGQEFVEPRLTFETPYDLPVTYSSTDESVAMVDAATGEVTLVAAGSTTIIAAFAGDNNYFASRATYLLIVSAGEGGTVEKTTPSMMFVDVTGAPVRQMEATLGEDFTEPRLTFETPYELPVTYSSQDENVATVNATTGEVTLVAAGSTNIIAAFAGDDNYFPSRAVYVLIVNEREEPPTAECPNARFMRDGEEILSLDIKVGERAAIPALVSDAGTYLQTSYDRMEDETKALVTADGMILGIAQGVSVLHLIAYVSEVMTCEYELFIVVKEDASQQRLAPELAFEKEDVNVELTENVTAPNILNPHNIDLTPNNSKWYTAWDSKVAKVDEQTGEITVIGVGDETITFEFTGNDQYEGAIISFKLHVTTMALTIGSVTVTNSNKDDILGDKGSVVYDPVTHTLTMTYAAISGPQLDLVPGRNRTAEDEEMYAAVRYTGKETLTIVLVGANSIINADAAIYSEFAPVVMMSSEAAYGVARISGKIVAVKAEALKLYQCDLTASGAVAVAVNELAVATGAHLTALGQQMAIQANQLVMAEDNKGEGIGILTAGVTFVPKQGFIDEKGNVATNVEIGKIVVPVPENEETTLDFTMIDPEGTETLIFSSTSQDRYNEETGQIELSSTLTDEQVETAMETLVPGSSQWKESLPGSITFDIPAGQGTITLEGWQSNGYVLKLKMGSQPVVTFTMDDAGQCVILYDTPAAIHVVIYLQVDKSSSPERIARVKAEDPVIGATIRSIKITPKGTSTGVDTIGVGGEVNGNTINTVNGKVLYNGHFFILRNGKTYTATGVEVK